MKQRLARRLPAADNAEEAEEYQADLDSDDCTSTVLPTNEIYQKRH